MTQATQGAGSPDRRVSSAHKHTDDGMERASAVDRRGAHPLGVRHVSGALRGLGAGGGDNGEDKQPGKEVSGAHRILRYGRAKRTDRLPR